MKTMSNVDIYTITDELNELLQNARVDKSFQPMDDTVVIRFHVPGTGRVDLVMQCGVRMHTSQYPLENPVNPPTFPMLLRKRIKGANVVSVTQHNFDRVVEIKVKKDQYYTIIIELFDKGNIILLDEEDNIILPLKRRKSSNRDISSKQIYTFPPEREINPVNATIDDLKHLFKQSDTDVVRSLARSGLGSLYAEEIILRSGVDKNKDANSLTDEEVEKLFESLTSIFNDLKNDNFKPQIVKNDVVPLDLEQYKNEEKQYFKSFNEACDEYYSKKINSGIKDVKEKAWNKKVGKFEKRLELQKQTLKDFEKTIESCQNKGSVIYSNYTIIENIINVVNNARENNYSFKEIGKTLKKAKKDGLVDAQIFESIDKMGVLTLDIDGVKINIDPKIHITENAEKYYEKSKKAKRKIKGALIAIENTEKQLADIKAKKDIEMEKVLYPKKRVKKNLKWFEKLRWFLSSDGTLVIGGRDANTNESVVKKYLDNNDIYMHADIHGASSIVVKKGDNEFSDKTLQESASFAASFSSAWSKGFSSQDVYWVLPEQVSKTPEAGEFVAKGSFIIRGNRNYIRSAKVQIAIGIVDYEGKRIMAAPVSALEKHSNNFIVLKPGFTKKEAIAKKILSKINEGDLLSIDDIVRVLPAGKCDIDEDYHQRKRYLEKQNN